MSEPQPAPVHTETLTSPERTLSYPPLHGLQARLALAGTDPGLLDYRTPATLTPDALSKDKQVHFKEVDQLIAGASLSERPQVAKEQLNTAVGKWCADVVRAVQSNSDFFTKTEQGKQFAEFFQKFGLNVASCTEANALEIYNQYCNGKSDYAQFEQKVFSVFSSNNQFDRAAFEANLPAIRWLANMFGQEFSADIFTQRMYEKVRRAADSSEYVAQSAPFVAESGMEQRSKDCIDFLLKHKAKAQRVEPTVADPTIPEPTQPAPSPTQGPPTTTPPTTPPPTQPPPQAPKGWHAEQMIGETKEMKRQRLNSPPTQPPPPDNPFGGTGSPNWTVSQMKAESREDQQKRIQAEKDRKAAEQAEKAAQKAAQTAQPTTAPPGPPPAQTSHRGLREQLSRIHNPFRRESEPDYSNTLFPPDEYFNKMLRGTTNNDSIPPLSKDNRSYYNNGPILSIEGQRIPAQLIEYQNRPGEIRVRTLALNTPEITLVDPTGREFPVQSNAGIVILTGSQLRIGSDMFSIGSDGTLIKINIPATPQKPGNPPLASNETDVAKQARMTSESQSIITEPKAADPEKPGHVNGASPITLNGGNVFAEIYTHSDGKQHLRKTHPEADSITFVAINGTKHLIQADMGPVINNALCFIIGTELYELTNNQFVLITDQTKRQAIQAKIQGAP